MLHRVENKKFGDNSDSQVGNQKTNNKPQIIVTSQLKMSGQNDVTWETLGWTVVGVNLIILPINIYNVYMFYRNRSTTFFQSRMPLATVILLCYQQLIILTKSANVLVILSYFPNTWIVDDLRPAIEMMPVYSLFFYKFGVVKY